jgi:aminopeptidase N
MRLTSGWPSVNKVCLRRPFCSNYRRVVILRIKVPAGAGAIRTGAARSSGLETPSRSHAVLHLQWAERRSSAANQFRHSNRGPRKRRLRKEEPMNLRSFSVVRILLTFCLLLGGVAAQRRSMTGARKAFGEPNVWKWPPSPAYHVENYRLVLGFDEPHGEVMGDEIVMLRPYHNQFRDFALDSSGLTIDGVWLVPNPPRPGGPVAFNCGNCAKLQFLSRDPKLNITLSREYAAGESLAVRIQYHGFPQTGLFFINPNEHYPHAPQEVWSQGESEFNHFWFPCWDYPNDKATSETIVTVPAGQSVVSNGELLGVTHGAQGDTYHWFERVPHSSYLISIAAGPWRKVHQSLGTLSVDYYVPNYVDEATTLRSFGLTPDMIAFYAKTFGVPYPYEKYAQTAVHNFTEGGMENVSATTQTEWTLHGAPVEPNVNSRGLVAHELSHQWFGDLVTTRDWANIWLNEGFATFIEALYTQHHVGNDDYRLEIWNDQQEAQSEDEHAYRRPIVDYHYIYPEQMFDATTYPKGGAVLDMMRTVLGDRLFFASLHHYLEVHRAGNADTADLLEAIRQTSGQNLDWFFHEWIYRGGFPEYNVHARYDSNDRLETVSIRQTQKPDAVTPIFDMPIELEFLGDNGVTKRVTVRDHLPEQDVAIPLASAPRVVEFDPDDHIYKKLTFDKSVEELVDQSSQSPSMMSRFWAVTQLGNHLGNATAEQAVINAALHDSFYGVRAHAVTVLGEMGGPEAKTAILTALREADSRVREEAASALGNFDNDRQVYDALIAAMHGDANPMVQAAAEESLGRTKIPDAVTELEPIARSNASSYIVNGALRGLAATRTAAAADVMLARAQPGSPERVRLTALRILPSMRPLLVNRQADIETLARESLDDPFPFVKGSGVRMVAVFKLKDLQGRIAALAKGAPTEEERRQAQQALDQLQQGEPPAEANSPQIQNLQRRVDQLEQRVKQLETHPAAASSGPGPK